MITSVGTIRLAALRPSAPMNAHHSEHNKHSEAKKQCACGEGCKCGKADKHKH